jgi:AcrR family transcriptional regulator
MNTADKIAAAAAKALVAEGLDNLTVAGVARQAGVSGALVHYHFDTKSRLIVAAASRLAAERAARLEAALAGGIGLQVLDALWASCEAAAGEGAEGAWLEFCSLAGREAGVSEVVRAQREKEARTLAAKLPGLLADLEASPAAGNDELAAAVRALLDGARVAILAGDDVSVARAAWDAFWLTLLSARPRRARR